VRSTRGVLHPGKAGLGDATEAYQHYPGPLDIESKRAKETSQGTTPSHRCICPPQTFGSPLSHHRTTAYVVCGKKTPFFGLDEVRAKTARPSPSWSEAEEHFRLVGSIAFGLRDQGNRIPGPNTPTKKIKTTTATTIHGELRGMGSITCWEPLLHPEPAK
jgi:hypothetical protein